VNSSSVNSSSVNSSSVNSSSVNSSSANKTNKNYPFDVYTLVQLKKSHISNSNKYVLNFVDLIIDTVKLFSSRNFNKG
jgi:hypothetical protein